MKDVRGCNGNLLLIISDTPDLSLDDQVDRYFQGLEPHISKELCTKDYEPLAEIMCDAESVKLAQRHGALSNVYMQRPDIPVESQRPLPMEIGNIELKKLTKKDRKRCICESSCLRCRQEGQLAKIWPKALRN